MGPKVYVVSSSVSRFLRFMKSFHLVHPFSAGSRCEVVQHHVYHGVSELVVSVPGVYHEPRRHQSLSCSGSISEGIGKKKWHGSKSIAGYGQREGYVFGLTDEDSATNLGTRI